MAAVTICSDFGVQENKVCHCFHCFPIYLTGTMWWDWMPWSLFFKCWVLSQLFHSPLSLSSRGSLIPLCFPGNPDSSLCFIQPSILHDILCVYELNEQGDNIQPWGTPFPIWNQSIVPCPVLTVASWWPAYQFLRWDVRWNVRSMNQGKLEMVKPERARMNINILGISELKWTGI